MQPYIIVLIALASALVLIFLFSLLCYASAFARRFDPSPKIKYFTFEDFSLNAEKVSLKNGLNGYIYNGKGNKNGKLVIFCHGMGPGQIAYTTEIAKLCSFGYTVLALDSFGCNFSKGKVGGMYNGVKTAVAAIDFANKDESLKGREICLLGHSWGAYSVLCAAAERKADKVVAISAPVSPCATVAYAASHIISKPFAFILKPFFWLTAFLRFGINGNANAAKRIEKSSTPALLIHGDNDTVVSQKNAAFFKAEGNNIKKYLAKGKGHNPYNTQKAEKQLAELSRLMRNKKADLSSFDFSLATEEDEDVMQLINNFITEN